MSDIEGAGMSTLEGAAAELAKVPWTYYMYVTGGTGRRLEVRRSRGLHGLSQMEHKVLTTAEVAALVWPGGRDERPNRGSLRCAVRDCRNMVGVQMTALTDYLASAECREEVKRLTIPGWDVREVRPALNALCEEREQDKARIRELEAEVERGKWTQTRLICDEVCHGGTDANGWCSEPYNTESCPFLVDCAKDAAKRYEQEAKPCPHINHTYRNHGGTKVCADCGETLEVKP